MEVIEASFNRDPAHHHVVGAGLDGREQVSAVLYHFAIEGGPKMRRYIFAGRYEQVAA